MLARLGVLYTSVVLTTVPMLGFDFDSRTSFRRKYLTPMLKNGVLKMTIPEKFCTMGCLMLNVKRY